MKNKALSVLRYFGIVGVIAGVVFATAVFADRPETVVICHATGTGYNQPPASATADAGGHAGQEHQDGRDIIPPFNFDGGSFPGQNWDAEGQAIWENGCNVPDPVDPVENTEPLCTDTEDNDGDELIDQADPDCAEFYTTDPVIGCMDLQATNYNLLATQDTDPSSCVYDEDPAICSDGIDNDEDGQTDYPNDPGCSSADDTDETNAVEPSVCTVVSDETNVVEGGTNAVETWNHVTWYDENILGSGANQSYCY